MVENLIKYKINKNFSVLGVIPARFKSSRFEGKPLVKIDGIPMIKRTFIQASKSPLIDELIVATDDIKILDYCLSENMPVIMTSTQCLTGTDRLSEVSRNMRFDFYINIQGDEPVIDPETISQLIKQYSLYGDQYTAYNLYKVIANTTDINSNTIIKVIVNANDELMYMSRLPVPYSNTNNPSVIKQQIPVYGYTYNALELFSSSGKTLNEQYEDIELLRFLDLGHKIKMTETFADSISVDIPSDIKKVELFLNTKS